MHPSDMTEKMPKRHKQLLSGGMTQHEVAAKLGISQGLVLRIETSAFKKLRALPEARALLQYVRFLPKEALHDSKS